MAKDTYRYLLRIPEELRRALVEAAQREGRSFNAEVTRRSSAASQPTGG